MSIEISPTKLQGLCHIKITFSFHVYSWSSIFICKWLTIFSTWLYHHEMMCRAHSCIVTTHFEKKSFKVRLIWDQLNTLWKLFSKCVKSVHHHSFWCKLLKHFEKKKVKLLALCFHLIDGITRCYNSLLNWE